MSNIEKLADFAKAFGCEVKKNEPMSRHTTFKIGGNAELFVTVKSAIILKMLIKKADELGEKYLVIGRGSNLLVSDDGIKGMVIALDGDFGRIDIKDYTITCGAAVPLSSLCKFALENWLTGLEFAFGIPGSVGGALFMNAGAYGSEMKNVVVKATHMTPEGEIEVLPLEELDLSYRHSIYHEKKAIILSVTIELKDGIYDDIKAQMDDILNRRKEKQPLEYPSAGSVFKRPEGHYAGALIEQCGLKGKQIGGAQVSEKHAGFIINTGNATCQDVLSLVKHIQDTVKENTGVDLECEIRPVD